MKTVSLREAEADLSRLIEAASRGEPFVIAENGRPLVRVVPAEAEPPRTRRLGGLVGQISVPDDFDTMFQDEIIRLFEGEEER
ncbi:type II toxin-antitoxin system prevent-host-death family antitoxin [Methylorubrum populi]|uniref:Antitoxin n=1 Tax=Methylorubrum populi TaxID=223967 RepID=A0A514KSU7_9HYPH|nr:type II toxin-antitoxin system prevent-host-death family antitoxin [Methylorubrum populi]KAB7783131.1 RelB/StbD replicon stabilization protein (antitoxin to RelE/StbE) [Methylorubrum populi]QDI82690.1 type II toxin-antitoxin system prevent-host-death family antitoxin [Methylorubrum populi]